MGWYKNEDTYYSEDDRFCIYRASELYHSGGWKMYDGLTKRTYYEDRLKDCKDIAEGIIKNERK